MQFSLEAPNTATVTVTSSISVSGGFTTLTSGVGRAKLSNSTNNEIVLKPKAIVTKVIKIQNQGLHFLKILFQIVFDYRRFHGN
jgi:hypothetical protein